MIANYHTHTSRCHHAVGQDEEYVLAAIDGGLKILGFSDHTPYLYPDGYCSHSRMLPSQLPEYLDSIRALGQTYAGQIEIHPGVEAEYYPALWNDTLSLLRDSGVEYMILGQHWNGNEVGHLLNMRPSDDPDRLRGYCRQVCQALETGVFSYLAHPDVICFTGSEALYEEQMRTVCRVARQCGIPLEINLLGIRSHRHYPSPTFWRIAGEEGCTAVLGCDAHDPVDTVDPISEAAAEELAQQFGLSLLSTIELKKL